MRVSRAHGLHFEARRVSVSAKDFVAASVPGYVGADPERDDCGVVAEVIVTARVLHIHGEGIKCYTFIERE